MLYSASDPSEGDARVNPGATYAASGVCRA